MGFIRKDAADTLWQWREIMLAGALALLGLWWGVTGRGLLQWFGVALGIGGAVLIWAGFQRLRFAPQGDGPGVVQIDEKRLAYFGPLTGGVIDLDDLTRVELDPNGQPAHWLLSGVGGQMVAVPVNAAGAEALFDVFAALPGIRTERMLDTLRSAPERRVVIWQAQRQLNLH